MDEKKIIEEKIKILEEKIKKIEEEKENLKKQADEYLAGWQRAKADYLNLEKEVAREKEEWIKFANLEFVLNFLPILDSFDAAFKEFQGEKDEKVQGFLNIRKQVEDFLQKIGLERIKTLGEKFNSTFHEAVKIEKNEKEGQKNEKVIVEEIQAGYIMNNKVIRPAKVIVK